MKDSQDTQSTGLGSLWSNAFLYCLSGFLNSPVALLQVLSPWAGLQHKATHNFKHFVKTHLK